MTVKKPPIAETAATAEDWKARYEMQKFLVGSMTSLLNRYGSSIELEQLYSAFLLTLMGQFVVGDACYYAYSPSDDALAPALAYGRLTREDLPKIAAGPDRIGQLYKYPQPTLVNELSLNLATATGMKFLSGTFRVFAPLFLKEKIVGAVFLGEKVSKQDYASADMDVLFALCAVSATTFNNAILYRNAKHSAREITRLYEVRTEVINRVTHEFRTPLTIIRAGAEMLANDERYGKLITLLEESGARLEDLINSLLSLSQQGKEDDSVHRTDAIVVLHDSIHRCSEAAREENIQFKVIQRTDASPMIVRMSADDIRTILNALIENAIKFSPSGAFISIEVELAVGGPRVERDGLQLPDWKEQTEDLLREYQELAPESGDAAAGNPRPALHPTRRSSGEYMVVRISDNGIGIPEQDLMTVAEPFRQASNSPDLGVKGKGLGLALVHKVVTRHGGYVCCKSAEGEGTTFSVYLPVESDSGI